MTPVMLRSYLNAHRKHFNIPTKYYIILFLPNIFNNIILYYYFINYNVSVEILDFNIKVKIVGMYILMQYLVTYIGYILHTLSF